MEVRRRGGDEVRCNLLHKHQLKLIISQPCLQLLGRLPIHFINYFTRIFWTESAAWKKEKTKQRGKDEKVIHVLLTPNSLIYIRHYLLILKAGEIKRGERRGEKTSARKEKKKNNKRKAEAAQPRLNQLHPKESFICIRICSKPEQMPDAFVCPVIYSAFFFFLSSFFLLSFRNCARNIKFA